MTSDSEEVERPGEWLLRLQQDGSRYRELVRFGGLPHAAYRVARARCLAAPLATRVPTLRELWAAACDLAHHTDAVAPSLDSLYDHCRHAGLLVIAEQGAIRARA